MSKLRIAILGTRGIPNRYGGFEQVAAHLGKGLVEKGHEVTVYSPHTHVYREKEWNGISIVHCFDPAYLGAAGQFVYDLNCILDARRKKFDIWLMLGYTSSSVWGAWYPPGTPVVTNMDGLEWKRSKYNAPVKRFLRLAEKLAVRYSSSLVADSTAIQLYLQQQYAAPSRFISYGAALPAELNPHWLDEFGVTPDEYFMVLARMEPENNIEMVLEGFSQVGSEKKILVIGNIQTGYGKHLQRKFVTRKNIIFHPAVYETGKLDALRNHCRLYFHGHSCGGTNPSLLEAMASRALIAAHDNPFNRAVLGADAFYFNNAADAAQLMRKAAVETQSALMKENNTIKIRTLYNWPKIVSDYETLLLDSYQNMHP